MINLMIFDVDGTLAKKFTLGLLAGVEDFFRLALSEECGLPLKFAIATNQGGVGLRYWMEQEDFGNPKAYPKEAEIEERMRGLVEALSMGENIAVYTAFAYRDRKGVWGPTPPDRVDDPRWNPEWRKPGAGMLRAAMQDAGASPRETLFVGDSDDDLGAARAAGCHFEWARSFFDRSWQDCGTLEKVLAAS